MCFLIYFHIFAMEGLNFLVKDSWKYQWIEVIRFFSKFNLTIKSNQIYF